MIIEKCPVVGNRLVAPETFVLTFLSRHLAGTTLPGQFVNVRNWAGSDPLLRRPFSVYHVEGDEVSIVFNIVGRGTRLLSEAQVGDSIDVLGPLGTSFNLRPDGFKVAILVAGGLGVAPMPMLTLALKKIRKPMITLLGARTKRHLITQYLDELSTATDDGSSGFDGNVVDLARNLLADPTLKAGKVFGCGPTPMLRALSELALELGIPCEISLEGPMGCGFGICQGCPVKLRGESREYALMCREGPVFSAERVVI